MNYLNVFGWLAMALIASGGPAKPVNVSTTTPNALSSWLEKLADCESRNNPQATNPHDGGSPSYGYLQFKFGTFKNNIRKYNLYPNTEDEELKNIIMDKDAQLLLAATMIKDDYSSWHNWENCVTGNGGVREAGKTVGLPPKINQDKR